jgi:hypothetical protein
LTIKNFNTQTKICVLKPPISGSSWFYHLLGYKTTSFYIINIGRIGEKIREISVFSSSSPSSYTKHLALGDKRKMRPRRNKIGMLPAVKGEYVAIAVGDEEDRRGFGKVLGLKE